MAPAFCRLKRLLVIAVAGSMLALSCSGGPAAEAGPKPTLTSSEREGKRLFDQYCASCHATSGETVIVGPSMDGIARRAGDRAAGMGAQDYLKASVTDPGGYLVEGFNDLMPKTLADALSKEELDAIVAYLLTLE